MYRKHVAYTRGSPWHRVVNISKPSDIEASSELLRSAVSRQYHVYNVWMMPSLPIKIYRAPTILLRWRIRVIARLVLLAAKILIEQPRLYKAAVQEVRLLTAAAQHC